MIVTSLKLINWRLSGRVRVAGLDFLILHSMLDNIVSSGRFISVTKSWNQVSEEITVIQKSINFQGLLLLKENISIFTKMMMLLKKKNTGKRKKQGYSKFQ